MPVEEHKELRELVSHTLQAKGVLQKVQAEIRASVFLALEEQDVFKDKNPFINTPLKNYLATSEGLLAVSLIKEFLDFFNLEFTSLVFDPETHAGIDYTYEGRQKITKDLKIDLIDNKVPLLGVVLKILTSNLKSPDTSYSTNSSLKKDNSKNDEKTLEQSDSLASNGVNGSINRSDNSSEEKHKTITDGTDKESRNEFENRFSIKRETAVSSSLASLSDLPPLAKPGTQSILGESSVKKQTTTVTKPELDSDDGRQLKYNKNERSKLIPNSQESGVVYKSLHKQVGRVNKKCSILNKGSNYDDDLLLPTNQKNIKDVKNDTNISEESEIEEDISEAASGQTDDNTVDLSISKGSGQADYLEDIQTSHLLD